jgi:DNA-binding response OmpR family regulator
MPTSFVAGSRPRIVVTDHDAAFLGLLEQLLREEGYEPLVPPKLDDPYAFIKVVRPAAVVLDAPFRQETATLAVLDTLRLDPETATIPAVVCTTAPLELRGLEGRQADGRYVLDKPFDLEQLLTILAAARRAQPPPRSTR